MSNGIPNLPLLARNFAISSLGLVQSACNKIKFSLLKASEISLLSNTEILLTLQVMHQSAVTSTKTGLPVVIASSITSTDHVLYLLNSAFCTSARMPSKLLKTHKIQINVPIKRIADICFIRTIQ